MKDWEILIKLLETNSCDPRYIAECVYAYLAEYGLEKEEDHKFMNELVQFIGGDYK
jgi:hypothetical protein